MNVLNYQIEFIMEDEGGYTVIVPSLPGCITFGETLEEATAMAKEAIEGYLETLHDLGKDPPIDDSISSQIQIIPD